MLLIFVLNPAPPSAGCLLGQPFTLLLPPPFASTTLRHGEADTRHQGDFPPVVTATMPSYHAWAIFA